MSISKETWERKILERVTSLCGLTAVGLLGYFAIKAESMMGIVCALGLAVSGGIAYWQVTRLPRRE